MKNENDYLDNNIDDMDDEREHIHNLEAIEIQNELAKNTPEWEYCYPVNAEIEDLDDKEIGIVSEKNVTLNKAKKYRENPFIERTIEVINPVKRKRYLNSNDSTISEQLINPDTGEVYSNAFYKIELVDDKKFAKFYIDNLKNHYDLIVSAQRVLNYILTILQPNKSDFYFDKEDAMDFTNYSSEKSIERGLRELVNKEIIAKSYKTNFYFINPTVAFNGDRIAFVKVAIKDKIDNKEELSNEMKQILKL